MVLYMQAQVKHEEHGLQVKRLNKYFSYCEIMIPVCDVVDLNIK